MCSNITDGGGLSPPRSEILELDEKMAELWRLQREAAEVFAEAEHLLWHFKAEAKPAALYELHGDRGLFNPAFYPPAGECYSDEAIDRLSSALAVPDNKASETAKRRVAVMVAARQRWSEALGTFKASVDFDRLESEADRTLDELFEAYRRMRDLPARTLDELRAKARAWHEMAGSGHDARNWNNPDERPDDDHAMLGSLLTDLIGDISMEDEGVHAGCAA